MDSARHQRMIYFLGVVRRGARIGPSTAFEKISPEQRQKHVKANRRLAGLLVLLLVRDQVA